MIEKSERCSQRQHSVVFLSTHDKVPTPPASNKNVGPSCRVFPAQRIAKARKMCPCATMRISPDVLCDRWPSDGLSTGS
jgi:hypothetical protein